jgi:hypothetical protein
MAADKNRATRHQNPQEPVPRCVIGEWELVIWTNRKILNRSSRNAHSFFAKMGLKILASN